jgi:DNA-binding NarL/FixJ family response regulator
MDPSSTELSALFTPEYQVINRKLYKLTIREWDVLVLLADGLTNAEIAAELFVEAKSIENYKSRIKIKLQLYGRNTLFRFSSRHKDHLKKFYKIVKSKM